MTSPSRTTSLQYLALSLVFGAPLGIGLSAIHVPLAFIVGPALVVVIMKRLQMQVEAPQWTVAAVQIALGMAVGLLFRDAVIDPRWNAYLVIGGLLICLALQFSFSYWWFRKSGAWTREEAMLGAVPGAMSAVLAITSSVEVPPHKIIVSHSIRLLLLVTLAGFIVDNSGSRATAVATPLIISDLAWLLLIAALAAVSGWILERARFVAPYMITSLLFAAIVGSHSGHQVLHFPTIFDYIAMTLLGVLIGTNVSALSLRDLYSSISDSLIVAVVNIIITATMACIWSAAQVINFKVLMLSWVPGSVETMTFAALQSGLDTAFVMSNHVIRMMLIQLIPTVAIAISRMRRRSSCRAG